MAKQKKVYTRSEQLYHHLIAYLDDTVGEVRLLRYEDYKSLVSEPQFGHFQNQTITLSPGSVAAVILAAQDKLHIRYLGRWGMKSRFEMADQETILTVDMPILTPVIEAYIAAGQPDVPVFPAFFASSAAFVARLETLRERVADHLRGQATVTTAANLNMSHREAFRCVAAPEWDALVAAERYRDELTPEQEMFYTVLLRYKNGGGFEDRDDWTFQSFNQRLALRPRGIPSEWLTRGDATSWATGGSLSSYTISSNL